MKSLLYLLLMAWGGWMVFHGLSSEPEGSGSYASGYAVGQLVGVGLGIVVFIAAARRLFAAPG